MQSLKDYRPSFHFLLTIFSVIFMTAGFVLGINLMVRANATSIGANISTPGNLLVEGNATTTGSFTVGTSTFIVDSETGNIGIGTSSPRLPITAIQSDLSSNFSYFGPDRDSFSGNQIKNYLTGSNVFSSIQNSTTNDTVTALTGVAESNTSDDQLYGVYGGVESTHDSGNKSKVVASGGDAYHSGSGSVDYLTGSNIYVANTGSGSIDRQIGFSSYLDNWSDGTVDDAYGFWTTGFGNYGSGEITNSYDFYGTMYTDAVNKYGVYIKGEDKTNYFAGNVSIGTTTFDHKLNVGGDINITGSYLTNGADYAEYFESEEEMNPGDIAGINTRTGLVRKYRAGDEFVGIVSSNPGFIGNNGDGDVLIGLVGQLDFNPEQVNIEDRIVHTMDGKRIGTILNNNKLFLK